LLFLFSRNLQNSITPSSPNGFILKSICYKLIW
jgi:hypothetical protein